VSQTATAQAVQPCDALVWEAAKFEKLLAQIPAFRWNTVQSLEKRLRELEERYQEVSKKNVGSRLSGELFRIAQRGRSEGKVEIPLSPKELAQLTGTTLFTVSRLLAQWQTKGIVTRHEGCIELRDISALNDLRRE
jgi:CRP-like cAMP-binding protein